MHRWLCLACCFLLPACSGGPKLLKVTGSITHNAAPLTVDPKGSVQLVFIPVVEAGKHYDTYPATFNPDDATFSVPGKDGRGIPPGKYRIAIMQMVPNPSPTVQAMNQRFTQDKSPIVRELTSEEPLVLDLAKAAP